MSTAIGPTQRLRSSSKQKACCADVVASDEGKFWNNGVEQDHRVPKQRVWLAKGYGSFHSVWRALPGIEAVHMIRKGQVRRVAKGSVAAQARFIAKLFSLAVSAFLWPEPSLTSRSALIKSSQQD